MVLQGQFASSKGLAKGAPRFELDGGAADEFVRSPGTAILELLSPLFSLGPTGAAPLGHWGTLEQPIMNLKPTKHCTGLTRLLLADEYICVDMISSC